MSAVFIDTNVLLYSVDEHDPGKKAKALAWLDMCWRKRCGRVSTQVLNEFYVNARRKFKSAAAGNEARAEVRRYQQWHPWIVDQATVETAWSVESRYRVHYWDALMVAAAQHQGCAVMLTEDLQHDQRMGDLRIVNPFRAGPETLSVVP